LTRGRSCEAAKWLFLETLHHSCSCGSQESAVVHKAQHAPPPRPFHPQTGHIVGKGGAVIRDLQLKSGAAIRVLNKAEVPPCARVGEEVAKVTGTSQAVAAGLRLLVPILATRVPTAPPSQLRVGDLQRHSAQHYLGHIPFRCASAMRTCHCPHPRRCFRTAPTSSPNAQSAAAHAPSCRPLLPSGGFSAGHAAGPALALLGGGSGMAGLAAAGGIGAGGAPVELTLHLLVPAAKVGNIIGKGGDNVRRIRAETGARVKVHEQVGGSEERLVSMTSIEEAQAPYCAAQVGAGCVSRRGRGGTRRRLGLLWVSWLKMDAWKHPSPRCSRCSPFPPPHATRLTHTHTHMQDALIRCVLSLSADDHPAVPQRVRLIIPASAVGALLGKRGSTVNQLRQETGAVIKIFQGGEAAGGQAPPPQLPLPTERPGDDVAVQIDGSMEQCVSALKGVATLLRYSQIRQMSGRAAAPVTVPAAAAAQQQPGGGMMLSMAPHYPPTQQQSPPQHHQGLPPPPPFPAPYGSQGNPPHTQPHTQTHSAPSHPPSPTSVPLGMHWCACMTRGAPLLSCRCARLPPAAIEA
jgi:transcription antitermination factor NusA-like protein